MPERDAKGFIRYSMEELQRIPPYEQRVQGASAANLGITGGTAGTLGGAVIGSMWGPVGTLVGGVAGATVGGAVGTFVNRAGGK